MREDPTVGRDGLCTRARAAGPLATRLAVPIHPKGSLLGRDLIRGRLADGCGVDEELDDLLELLANVFVD
jgi:hypothetical protein